MSKARDRRRRAARVKATVGTGRPGAIVTTIFHNREAAKRHDPKPTKVIPQDQWGRPVTNVARIQRESIIVAPGFERHGMARQAAWRAKGAE